VEEGRLSLCDTGEGSVKVAQESRLSELLKKNGGKKRSCDHVQGAPQEKTKILATERTRDGNHQPSGRITKSKGKKGGRKLET